MVLAIDGLEELGKSLGPRQNLMLYGPPMSGKTTLGLQFLHSGLVRGEHAILLATGETAESAVGRARIYGWEFEGFEREGILRVLDCYSRSVGIPCSDTASILRLPGPSELTGISVAISRLCSDFRKTQRQIRMLFDSVSSLLLYASLPRVLRFLHVLLGRLKAVDAVSLLVVEEGMHHDEAVTGIETLCDGLISLSKNAKTRYIEANLVHGILGKRPLDISSSGVRIVKDARRGWDDAPQSKR